jgi:O-antigen ligase
LAVVLAGFVRMFLDRSHLDEFTTATLISEYLVNTVKWVVPGLLLFDGCRNRRRMTAGITCVLMVYFLLALQVIRWMPPSSAVSGEALTERSRALIMNETGYHPVNMSMMLSGASWATFATLPLVRRRGAKAAVAAAALLIVYGQALTAGRMGYVTWGTLGLVLCLLKWRKYLLFFPFVVLGIGLAVPGAADRMFAGFGETDVTGEAYTDDYVVTSGRTLIWPHVLDKITASPVVGYGRLAMYRTGLFDYLRAQFGEGFPHPHNAYLECLLDNGLVGFLVIVPFYLLLVVYAAQLFRDRRNPWFTVVGGVALSLLLALLVASMGSQTFYPREGAVCMWAAIGLMLRVRLVRQRTERHPSYPAALRSPRVPSGGAPLRVQGPQTSRAGAVPPDAVRGPGARPF